MQAYIILHKESWQSEKVICVFTGWRAHERANEWIGARVAEGGENNTIEKYIIQAVPLHHLV